MSVIVFITYFLQKQTSRNLQLNVFIVEILSLDMYIKLIRRKYIMKEYISCIDSVKVCCFIWRRKTRDFSFLKNFFLANKIVKMKVKYLIYILKFLNV